MPPVNCILPIKVRISGNVEGVSSEDLSELISQAVGSRLRFAQQRIREVAVTASAAEFHDAEVKFRDSLPQDSQARLRAAISAGVTGGIQRNSVNGAAGSPTVLSASGLTSEKSGAPRVGGAARPEAAQAASGVVTFEEGDVLTVSLDKVIEHAPPFQDALVLQLPGNHYVKVKSHRYARSDDIARAQKWGRVLFGAEAWVLLVRAERHSERYYVASLDEAITEADVHPQLGETGVPGATGVIAGRVLAKLLPDFYVVSVFLHGGGRVAPTGGAFTALQTATQESLQQGTAKLEGALVRQTVFEPIDKLLASGKDDDLEKAADLLAELDVTAFATLDIADRFTYLSALVRAWTLEPQEVAIIEILKSVESLSELKSLFQQLKSAKLWDQMFNDLDSQLWSLLITLGQKFGDPMPLTLTSLNNILLEAKLVSIAPGIILDKNGNPEITLDLIAEVEEAARGFVRFVQGALEGIWMLLSHPDKVIEGIGQLVKMTLMFDLAQSGYPPAQQYVLQVVGHIGKQLVYGLKGAAITEMGPAIQRRIMYAIIWEVASWFIGVGEVKAALEGVGISERLAALARFLGILKAVEEVTEGERIATNLEKVAAIIGRSSKILTREEEVLQLLSHLPEKDAKLLAKALEHAEIGEGLDLVKLAESSKELAEVATESMRKAEALSQLAANAGGLSDEVAQAFGRLSEHFNGEQIGELVKHVGKEEGARFTRAVTRIPEGALGKGGTAPGEFLRVLAEDPKRMDALANFGYRSFAGLYARAEGDAAALDQYLAALSEIEGRLPGENRAVEFRRFLDQLERGDAKEWLKLEEARAGRFEHTTQRLDPETVERWLDEELAKFGPREELGTKPLVDPTAPPAPEPPPVQSFQDALAAVDLSEATPQEIAALKDGWKTYQTKPRKFLKTEDEYLRFVYGKRTKQLPKVLKAPRDLGAVGAIEQEAGLVLERVVDAHLPPGSANTREIPTRYANVIPDHLPPGGRTIYLNPDGTISATPSGTPFSARFVGDSKYRDIIPTTNQTRGFAKLAALSDEKKLIFYVRWKDGFPAVESLTGHLGVGYQLPAKFVPEIVGAGVRGVAREGEVEIVLISNPLWR